MNSNLVIIEVYTIRHFATFESLALIFKIWSILTSIKNAQISQDENSELKKPSQNAWKFVDFFPHDVLQKIPWIHFASNRLMCVFDSNFHSIFISDFNLQEKMIQNRAG